jgi:hypothetical protein
MDRRRGREPRRRSGEEIREGEIGLARLGVGMGDLARLRSVQGQSWILAMVPPFISCWETCLI